MQPLAPEDNASTPGTGTRRARTKRAANVVPCSRARIASLRSVRAYTSGQTNNPQAKKVAYVGQARQPEQKK